MAINKSEAKQNREIWLDVFYELHPRLFNSAHKTYKGNGRKMIVHVYKHYPKYFWEIDLEYVTRQKEEFGTGKNYRGNTLAMPEIHTYDVEAE